MLDVVCTRHVLRVPISSVLPPYLHGVRVCACVQVLGTAAAEAMRWFVYPSEVCPQLRAAAPVPAPLSLKAASTSKAPLAAAAAVASRAACLPPRPP